jgi:uncharacterized protein (UPF0548 family)
MPSLTRPSTEALRRFLAKQALANFSYPAVGATASMPPLGYVVDRTRVKLGQGEGDFRAACGALERWRQFDLGWVEAWPDHCPLEVGQVVAVLGRAIGLWWLNACRIVYVVRETEPIRRFGFAYGTLPAHAESGEERFLVEWDPATDEVWYDILAFSRPQLLATRLGYPVVRRAQRRFARESAARMQRAVAEASR